jgi:hypothetical protein
MAHDLELKPIPAVIREAGIMLAHSHIREQKLIKALAHLGCSCTVKLRDVDPQEHETFCRFRMKMEDLL